MIRARTRLRGISLLEVLIASIILVAVIGMSLAVLYNSSSIAQNSSSTSHLEARGREFLQYCRTQFYTGRFRDPINVQTLGLYQDNTEARYQVPVNRDATGAMQYGYTHALGLNDPAGADKVCVLRFEADTVLREGSASPVPAQKTTTSPLPAFPFLAPSLLNMDINQDGDRLDSFVRGKIVRYVLAPNGAALALEATEELSGDVILAVDPVTGGFDGRVDPRSSDAADLDGEFRGDWLFRYLGATNPPQTVVSSLSGNLTVAIQITSWHGAMDPSGKRFLLRRNRETVRFRNPQ